MTEFGDPHGHSALAKLVGVTCAIAVTKILDGSISERGVIAPTKWRIAKPILQELRHFGIRPHGQTSFRTTAHSDSADAQEETSTSSDAKFGNSRMMKSML